MKRKYKVLNGLFACALTIGVIATPTNHSHALATDDFQLSLVGNDKIFVDLLTAKSVVLPNGNVVTSDTTYTATENNVYTFVGVNGEEKTQRSITTSKVNAPIKKPFIVAPGQQVFLNMESNDAHSGVTDSRIRTSETDTTWADWGAWTAFNKKQAYVAPAIGSNNSAIKTIQAQYKDLAGNISSEVSAQLVVDSTKPISELDSQIVYTNTRNIIFPFTIKSQWVAPDKAYLSESPTFQKGSLLPPVVYDFNYTGGVQTFTAPYTDKYLLQVWGAKGGQGGDGNYPANGWIAGKGGYANGKLALQKGETVSVYVGGQGLGIPATSYSSGLIKGGWNGGGDAYHDSSEFGGSGGGGTDIRKGGTSLTNRVIVAGGGGGTGEDGERGGDGGGESSVNSYASNYDANQTKAGTRGALGLGASYNSTNESGGGGGGGYYGGGGGEGSGSGGGSAYVGGVEQGIMISGANSIPAPTGGTETGHSGNGFARIVVPEFNNVSDDFTEYTLKDYTNLFTGNDPASSWKTYKYEVPFQLSSGEGQKTVYMKSNKTIAPSGTGQSQSFTSDTVSRKVVYDATAPTGTILINNGDDVVNSEEVELSINTSDALSGVSEVKITEWSLFEDNSAPKEEKSEIIKNPSASFKLPWTMAEGEKKMFTMTLKDKAGNTVTKQSNIVEYVKLSVSRVDLTNVVNPDVYNKRTPFKTLTLPTQEQSLMAGGSFDFKTYYDIGTMDPTKTVVQGFYTVSVQKPVVSNGKTNWELSNLKIPFTTKANGENAFTASYDIPKKTPKGTKISISIEIEAYNRDKPASKHSFAYYPNTSVPNLIGTIGGDIEEKLRFNGIN